MAENNNSGCGLWGWAFTILLVLSIFNLNWSKVWYCLRYDVRYSQVTMEPRPHDCEWGTAPLGDKHCSYSAQISTVRVNISTTGKPIISSDGGQTWYEDAATPRTEPSVYVSWKKVEDE